MKSLPEVIGTLFSVLLRVCLFLLCAVGPIIPTLMVGAMYPPVSETISNVVPLRTLIEKLILVLWPGLFTGFTLQGLLCGAGLAPDFLCVRDWGSGTSTGDTFFMIIGNLVFYGAILSWLLVDTLRVFRKDAGHVGLIHVLPENVSPLRAEGRLKTVWRGACSLFLGLLIFICVSAVVASALSFWPFSQVRERSFFMYLLVWIKLPGRFVGGVIQYLLSLAGLTKTSFGLQDVDPLTMAIPREVAFSIVGNLLLYGGLLYRHYVRRFRKKRRRARSEAVA